jgi:tRNA pseudouridine55 synthase
MTEDRAIETPQRGGILLVDKPGGMTSHDVVSRVRRLAGTRRVGHAGTLDPMATGLLALGLGAATRLLTYLVGLDKEYLATIRLGAATPSDDADTPVHRLADPDRLAALAESDIRAAIVALTGEIRQVPSTVSAIKVDGKRAYARARAGEPVELGSRAVVVSAFDVLAIRPGEFVDLDVRVECSTGTYVRALARDLGSGLGVGGHLTALRRTRVGPFRIERAARLDDLDPAAALLDPAAIARELFPVLELSPGQAIDLGHGKRLPVALPEGGPVAAIDPGGRLVGLVEVAVGVARPLVNFPQEETP